MIESYPKIQYSIIEKIHLEFNIERTSVQIYYDKNVIGNIKLNLKEIKLSNIYVDDLNISNSLNTSNIDIEINIIFTLIEILRAYYAPIQMFLLLKYEKKNDNIAFELEFAKKGNHYIKKC
jgi:hypothetical protein